MTLYAGQKATAARINSEITAPDTRLPLGVIARGRRSSASTGTTTTEIGVMRLDNVAVYAGRQYQVMTSEINLATTVANDVVAARLRFTSDGTTATTASPQLTLLRQKQAETANTNHTALLSRMILPSVDTTLSVLVTVVRVSGTGTVSLYSSGTEYWDLMVVDQGLDVTDTAVLL